MGAVMEVGQRVFMHRECSPVEVIEIDGDRFKWRHTGNAPGQWSKISDILPPPIAGAVEVEQLKRPMEAEGD